MVSVAACTLENVMQALLKLTNHRPLLLGVGVIVDGFQDINWVK